MFYVKQYNTAKIIIESKKKNYSKIKKRLGRIKKMIHRE